MREVASIAWAQLGLLEIIGTKAKVA